MDESQIFIILVFGVLLFSLMPLVAPETGAASADPLINGLHYINHYTVNYLIPFLIPGFFLAGALSAFLPKAEITKYLSKKVTGLKTYLWAAEAGLLLAVYSRTILPLFAGLRKKGSEIGPSMTFLYAVCGTNVISLIFTSAILGFEFAAARLILTVFFALVAGAAMSTYFKEDTRSHYRGMFEYFEEIKNVEFFKELDRVPRHDKKVLLVLFATLFMILITASLGIGILYKVAFIAALTVLLVLQLRNSFSEEDIVLWLQETIEAFRYTTPLLFIGLFLAGVFFAFAQAGSLSSYAGETSATVSFLAAAAGVSVYLPPLLDVLVAKMLTDLGVDKGAALAFLMASSVLSTPTMLILNRILGPNKTRTYIFLVIFFSALSGLVYSLY